MDMPECGYLSTAGEAQSQVMRLVEMAAQPRHHGGNDILSMHRNRNMSMTITANMHVPVNVKAHVHENMNMSVINVVDGLNAPAGDTWQKSDAASQA